jgi:molybdopterin converting factor small subunit
MLQFKIRLFSILKAEIGFSSVDAIFTEPTLTGKDLLDKLEALYPPIETHRHSIQLAVNQNYVGDDVLLQNGDEIALITPVSGG